MRVAIIHGAVPPDAPADERDVLVEVGAVTDALSSLGYETVRIPVTLDLSAMAAELTSLKPAFVFNLVESLEGRGSLINLAPAVLDFLGIPYTGANANALLLTSNKLVAKRMMRAAGIPTPNWFPPSPPVGEGPGVRAAAYIIKSVWEHASIGLDDGSVVSADKAGAAIREKSARHGGEWFAEEYIEGREFNVSVIAGPDGPVVMPPAEMLFTGDWDGRNKIVDYKAKWEEGSSEYAGTQRGFATAPEDGPLLQRLRDISLGCWRSFGLRGYARVDFRVDTGGSPWVLEVNANPCISPDAGLAAAAREAGIEYNRLIERVADDR